MEIEPPAAIAVALQHPLREFRVREALCAPGNLVGQVFRQLDIFRNRFYDPNPFCLFCLVAQLYLTLCNPMDCSTPGLSVPHHLPKFAQVHAHCIGNTSQPSHPLMPSSLLPSIFSSIRDL